MKSLAILFLSAFFSLSAITKAYAQRTGICIFIKDRKTEEPVKALVKIISPATGDTIYTGESTDDGRLLVESIPTGADIITEADGFLLQSDVYTGEKEIDTLEIRLEKIIRICCPTIIRNIYFDKNSFAPSDSSEIDLDKVKRLLEVIPDSVRIEIRGFFSPDEKKKIKNQYLSYLRAKAVYEALSKEQDCNCIITYEQQSDDKNNKLEESRKVEFYVVDK